MPGGTFSITFGKQSNLINQEESYKDPKGQQNSIQFEANGKKLIVITIY